eukprot:TRINITY_DN679_c0_g1_i1.p1 TRINITY_DN679_c0_g1~~TRINITY_DN679_c0_g1_i1.p1  ORF type:complete len:260 (-),score=63.68 TRINITY_DN679_c0_g1_i1:24-803(-)
MGIGRQMAFDFAKNGCKLILIGIVPEEVAEVAKSIIKNGGEAHHYECDVSNRKIVLQMAAKVLNEHKKIDILVNNAGVVSGKYLLDLSEEDITKTIGVNLLGHFWMLKAFLPKMIESNEGHIVTISSVCGFTPLAGLSDYCASKYAVNGLHESLRMELAREKAFGIKTTLVCPYAINTGMFEGIDPCLQWFFPILKPEFVSKSIVEAIKREKMIIFLPSVFSLIVPLMRIVPTEIFDFSLRLLGATDSMDKFRGRHKQK